MRQLCSSLLHKFSCFMTVSFSIRLKALKELFGVSASSMSTKMERNVLVQQIERGLQEMVRWGI